MRNKFLGITLLAIVALCYNGAAANELGLSQLRQSDSVLYAPSANQSESQPSGEMDLLIQDSGGNLSKMNITFAPTPTYGSAQTVKFTAPRDGWNLKHILAMATDGWNSSSKQLPNPLPFTIEIRDANFSLLYQFSGVQFPYFTSEVGVRMADIEVPSVPVNGDFYVCFYGYRSLGLAAELQNATGNSYFFDKLTDMLYPGALPLKNNQTLPVNWIIRAAGQ